MSADSISHIALMGQNYWCFQCWFNSPISSIGGSSLRPMVIVTHKMVWKLVQYLQFRVLKPPIGLSWNPICLQLWISARTIFCWCLLQVTTCKIMWREKGTRIDLILCVTQWTTYANSKRFPVGKWSQYETPNRMKVGKRRLTFSRNLPYAKQQLMVSLSEFPYNIPVQKGSASRNIPSDYLT